MYLELPIASFISAVLSLAPLPWHWRAGTVPTISIALWLFVANMINGIDSIVWANTAVIKYPVWCDISTKIIMGANVALPASIFCLCVHLERVSSARQVSTDRTQKRRRQYLDGFLCFGVPMIYMALHYIVQGHRFDIIENFGCRASTYVSVASIFLIWVPPLLFSLGSFVLSALSFRNFWQSRITFARHLQNNSALTPSRYFRLMVMSLIQMLWGVTITAFNMWFTMRGGLRPWISWSDVHYNFSRIAQFPAMIIPPKDLLYTYLLWWTVPISTFIFFAFFSFGQDAVKEYCACYTWIKRKIFRCSDSPKVRIKDALPLHSRKSDSGCFASTGKSNAGYTKSEVTLSSPSPSDLKGYKWNPPPSPNSFSSSPTCYAYSMGDVSTSPEKAKDLESIADTHSLSSYHTSGH